MARPADGHPGPFGLATYDRNQETELVKRLVGQRTSSHARTYVVRRKGLLDEIPHVRRIRGAVVVRTEDAGLGRKGVCRQRRIRTPLLSSSCPRRLACWPLRHLPSVVIVMWACFDPAID